MGLRTILPGLLLDSLSLFVLRFHLGTCSRICGRTSWHGAVGSGPFHGPGLAGSAYFARVGFKKPRPWFRGFRAPRGYINLVTRLRTGHICTGEHFARMGWNLDADCGCGAELRSLQHLFLNCAFCQRAGRGFSASWRAVSLACHLINLIIKSSCLTLNRAF